MGLFAEWQPAYAARGVPTFPVVVDGGAKRPAVKGYLKLGSDVSRQLAMRFPANDSFGFALGKRSRLTVLDIDTPDEGVLADAMSRHGTTPVIVRSGSGNWQAWYRHNGEPRRIRPWGAGVPIDLLGGGYVVAPPSRGSRGHYQFVQGGLDDLDSLPAISGVADAAQTPRPAPAAGSAPATEGNRNNSLWRFCMRHALRCASLDDLMRAARERNSEFAPPLEDCEVMRAATSAWSYTETGQNWFGDPKTVRIDHSTVDSLAAQSPDAVALLLILERNHAGAANFVLAARAMSAGLRWGAQRWRKARDRLVKDGIIRCIHAGGRGKNDPPIYRWA